MPVARAVKLLRFTLCTWLALFSRLFDLEKISVGIMKDGIHPSYQSVVFHDVGADYKFLTRSTMSSKEKITWTDGKEYPLITVDISSASHPFFTGKMKYVDSAGRVEKFQKKYGWGKKEG